MGPAPVLQAAAQEPPAEAGADVDASSLEGECPAEEAAAPAPWHWAFGLIRKARNLEGFG